MGSFQESPSGHSPLASVPKKTEEWMENTPKEPGNLENLLLTKSTKALILLL